MSNGSRLPERVINVVMAGLGGQGVLTASDILAGAAFLSGLDVKKAELHGMSQRSGPVTADIRFGQRVFSPMVPGGAADFLLVLAENLADSYRAMLRQGGVLIEQSAIDPAWLPSRRSANLALLGVLSRHLDLDIACWYEAMATYLRPELLDANRRAFAIGRMGV